MLDDVIGIEPLEPHRAELPTWALPKLPRHRLRLILDQVRSAHNVGALFRTADAAAVDRIYLLGLTPHPPHSQVEKTALGATTYVPWEHHQDSQALLQQLAADGYELVAVENGPGSTELWQFEWPRKTALLAGNEVEGVSTELLEACSKRVCLPMYGYKRSLNVTTAMGIVMYEFLRSVRQAGGSHGDENSWE